MCHSFSCERVVPTSRVAVCISKGLTLTMISSVSSWLMILPKMYLIMKTGSRKKRLGSSLHFARCRTLSIKEKIRMISISFQIASKYPFMPTTL